MTNLFAAISGKNRTKEERICQEEDRCAFARVGEPRRERGAMEHNVPEKSSINSDGFTQLGTGNCGCTQRIANTCSLISWRTLRELFAAFAG